MIDSSQRSWTPPKDHGMDSSERSWDMRGGVEHNKSYDLLELEV